MAQQKDSTFLQAPLHRKTRSGRSFATWEGPHVTVLNPEFHFDSRLQDAIELERAQSYDESGGYDSDTLTPPSSPFGTPEIFAQSAAEQDSVPLLNLSHQDNDQASDGDIDVDFLAPLRSPDGSLPTLAWKGAVDNETIPVLRSNGQDSDYTAIPVPPPRRPAIHSTNNSEVLKTSVQTQRHKRRRKNTHVQRQAKRIRLKATTYGGGHTVQPKVQSKYVQPSVPINVDITLEEARVASTGYVGLDDGERSKKVFSKEELISRGFTVIRWNGITPTPIVVNGQFIGLLAGRASSDSSWDSMMAEAAAGFERARKQCHIPSKQKKHRRGPFSALRSGVSHGGGQRRPGNLRNNPVNAAALDTLSGLEAFIRLAGFASSAMCNWAPRLYQYYVDELGALFEYYPDLKRNFSTSIFTANTYNLGPKTVCYKHTDFGNLPFGLCAITALGSFDPEKGGHLVLWECKLIIEFPPGSTILILSAIIAHFNLPISPGETRYSFTQFSSGALFRWVSNGFQKSTDYWASLSPEARKEEEKKEADRWLFGLSLLPTLHTSDHPSPSFV